MKRVHIEVVRLTARMIRHSNLTPARFDLMRIVQLYPHGIAQGTIRWLLGVTAPVVSRMLKGLEALGYVSRERAPRDGRSKWIRLTTRGQIAVGIAGSETLGCLDAERMAACLVTGNHSAESESHGETVRIIAEARDFVAAFDATLVSMRSVLADRAAFHHPWLPICDRYPPMLFTELVDGRLRYGDEDLLTLLT